MIGRTAADVLAWLTTIANVSGVDLSEAVTRKYGSGCPGCLAFQTSRGSRRSSASFGPQVPAA